MKTFRFDDVCLNADSIHTNNIARLLRNKFPDCCIIYAVSPLVVESTCQRVYPKIWNALSDYRQFYKVTDAAVPVFFGIDNITVASHGLIHVDHRLLAHAAQEMSILVSCSLVRSKIFVPPFNKWNKHTEDICNENGIDLIKFEDGWRCMEYEPYNTDTKLWYLHARELTLKQVEQWINQE